MKAIKLVSKENINVGKRERIISGLAGSVLVISSFSKGVDVIKLLSGGYLLFRGITGFCPAYKGISKNTAEMRSDNINIKTSIIVNKPRAEVYAFWRKLDNLPLFMEHLEQVKVEDDKYSEWTAEIPGGIGTVTWKSEIVKDEVNERIGWRSIEGSDIFNAGNVHFKDAKNFGTEVHVAISYRLTGGTPVKALGRLVNPVFEKIIREDVESFKNYFEAGVVKS